MFLQGRFHEDSRPVGNKRRYVSSSPFRPHQSKRECERRQRQGLTITKGKQMLPANWWQNLEATHA